MENKKSKKEKVVCIGDSITGWNNMRDESLWPTRTYPAYLGEHLTIDVKNLGVAGATSNYCVPTIETAKRAYPEAEHYIISFKTNDIGKNPDIKEATEELVYNLKTRN